MYWIVVGDIHENADRLAEIPGADRAAGIIISGDLTTRGGRARAADVLDAALAVNPHVIAQVGNMDLPEVTDLLADRGANIHRTARRLAPGLAVMGVGCSNLTPMHTPSEASEEELTAWLNEAHDQARDLAGKDGKVLAVIHTPPKGTPLDRLPNGASVGSQAVREFLLKAQPEVCVCGHIHEAQGETRLGRCHALNPGMLSAGGYVRVDFAEGRLSAGLGRL